MCVDVLSEMCQEKITLSGTRMDVFGNAITRIQLGFKLLVVMFRLVGQKCEQTCSTAQGGAGERNAVHPSHAAHQKLAVQAPVSALAPLSFPSQGSSTMTMSHLCNREPSSSPRRPFELFEVRNWDFGGAECTDWALQYWYRSLKRTLTGPTDIPRQLEQSILNQEWPTS